LKAVRKFQKALTKNYYKDFLAEAAYDDVNLQKHYEIPVYYHSQWYLEMDLDLIVEQSKEIREQVKDLYNEALREIHLILAEKKQAEFIPFFEYLEISLLKTIEAIKTEFYIDSKKSKFYSSLDILDPEQRLRDIFSSASKELKAISFYNFRYDDQLIYNLWFYDYRFKRLSFLPMSLFVIGTSFLKEIQKIKKIKSPENSEISLKTNLSCNQVVLFLEKLMVFDGDQFKDLSIPRKAKLISHLTGYHYKNIEDNIRKLEKKPSVNGKRYKEDSEMVINILKGITE
jgi:hypothetical protein